MDAVQDDELEKFFQEGDQHGVGSLIKTIWFTDKKWQKEEFFQDQAKNGMGFCVLALYYIIHAELKAGHGNQWNMITIRMGMLNFKLLCYFKTNNLCSTCYVHA